MSLRVSGSLGGPSRAADIAARASAVDRTGSTQPSRGTGPAGLSGAGAAGVSARSATGHSGRSTSMDTSRTQPGAATGSLRAGARGDEVRSLQNRLRSAGFDPGRSDGIFGPRTERAVRGYQRSLGLQTDGVAGRRTFAALNGPDSFEPSRPAAQGGVNGTNSTEPSRPAAQGGVNGTARLDRQPTGRGMTTGNITVNGHSYQFNSGSGNLFSVPQGTYRVTAHRNNRSEAAFSRDGVGYSFRLEDARRPNSDAMFDRRAGRDRTALRIHPDGGARGTAGCIGIVGDGATMRRFRDDMNAELRRNGGAYTLRVQ